MISSTRRGNHHHSSQSLFGITYYWTELSSTSRSPLPLPSARPPLSPAINLHVRAVAIIFTLTRPNKATSRRGGGGACGMNGNGFAQITESSVIRWRDTRWALLYTQSASEEEEEVKLLLQHPPPHHHRRSRHPNSHLIGLVDGVYQQMAVNKACEERHPQRCRRSLSVTELLPPPPSHRPCRLLFIHFHRHVLRLFTAKIIIMQRRSKSLSCTKNNTVAGLG